MTVRTEILQQASGGRQSVPSERLPYRPYIDGLRAVAICLVVGFHYFPSLMPGGFIGVDIFFVVSGYLITSVILNGRARGKFTLSKFYLGRARRLFPALGAMLLCVLFGGWLLFLDSEFRSLGKHAAAGVAYAINGVLLTESGYFDVASQQKPLLHLWSLAIEEQFYITWPLLVILLARWKKFFLGATATFFVLSLVAGIYVTAVSPALGFYLPITRGWELLLGCLLAIVPRSIGGMRVARLRRRLMANTASAVAVALLFTAILVIKNDYPYPSGWALLPVVAAGLLIAAGPDAWLNERVLSNRLMTWIGRLSYSLYLWHWPIIAFYVVIAGQTPSLFDACVLLLVSVSVSVLSLKFVEAPVRKIPLTRGLAAVLCLAMTAIFAVGASAFLGYLKPRTHGMYPALEKSTQWPYVANDDCSRRFPFEQKHSNWWFCFVSGASEPDVLLMGNSLANELYAGFSTAPDLTHRTILSTGACSPTRDVIWNRSLAYLPNPCYGSKAKSEEKYFDDLISRQRFKFVVINFTWPEFNRTGEIVGPDGRPGGSIELESGRPASARAAFTAGFESRIAQIESVGSRPIVFLPMPRLPYNYRACFDRPLKNASKTCEIPRTSAENERASFIAVMGELQRRHPGLLVYDPFPALCDSSRCRYIRDGQPLMRDDVHLSVLGSQVVVQDFAEWAKANLPEMVE